jgi:hypothetical protein
MCRLVKGPLVEIDKSLAVLVSCGASSRAPSGSKLLLASVLRLSTLLVGCWTSNQQLLMPYQARPTMANVTANPAFLLSGGYWSIDMIHLECTSGRNIACPKRRSIRRTVVAGEALNYPSPPVSRFSESTRSSLSRCKCSSTRLMVPRNCRHVASNSGSLLAVAKSIRTTDCRTSVRN